MAVDLAKEVWLSSQYLANNPAIPRENLRQALSEQVLCPLPTRDTPYWDPNMGTTHHNATPTAIDIEGVGKIHVYSKAMEPSAAAMLEFQNIQTAIRRGINTPPAIASILYEDMGFLITVHNHLAEPLSARRLDFKFSDVRYNNPSVLLARYTQALAGLHNAGINHGDLHLGNIGDESLVTAAPTPIFFDFEAATVLSDDELLTKNRGVFRSPAEQFRFDYFEQGATANLGRFTASLKRAGLPMRKGQLLREAYFEYLGARQESYGLKSGKVFYTELAANYDRYIRAVPQYYKN